MMHTGLKRKIILPSLIILTVLVTAMTVYSSFEFIRYTDLLKDEITAEDTFNLKDISNELLIKERNQLIVSNIIIGLAGLVLSIIVMFYVLTRNIKPVYKLLALVSDITQGNLDVNTDRTNIPDDELGILSSDIYLLIDTVKSMLNDLSQITEQLNKSGDIEEFQIDSCKYSGSYREIVEGVNALCNSISLKNKTMVAMDFLGTMINIVDFDYNILYMNKSLMDVYKVDKEKCFKQKCYKAIRKLEEPCPQCRMQEFTDNKDSYPSSEYYHFFDDCIGKWVGVRSSIIPWVDGSKVLCNYLNDETQSKNYEEKLRDALHKAQESSISKSVFLAHMSHEIRTPMNSIIGFSELALDDELSFRTREYLNKILENASGLLRIINDILDISKVESGRMELENIPFDMHELFTSCRSLITPKAVEKGIMLHFYVEPSIGKIPLGDPTRLRQVLTNLLSNAVKFTNTGTVKVFVGITDKTEKTVTMCFEVKDSGIGMTHEQIERVFDPFTQAETGTTRKYGGTGLGLPITRNIVELMGGVLKVDSTPGVGSKFSFTLTFNTINSSENDTKGKKIILNEFSKPAFEGEVLLCEDNAMNQQVICEHLSRVGLKTVVAWNGRLGLDIVKGRKLSGEKQFDLIFMDMHMPVMDGLEATERIMDLQTGIPIIAMTANVMEDDKEIYKMSGITDYVGKPFTSQELWRCLLKYLKPLSSGEKNLQTETANTLEADVKFQISLKKMFARNNKNKFEEITKALSDNDIKLAHRLLHTLKNNAGQLGKIHLRQAASEIESLLKEGKKHIKENLLENLQNELIVVLNELSPLLFDSSIKTENSESQKWLDKNAALELLEKLEPMLRTGNPECMSLTGSIHRIKENEILRKRLLQQMDDFEFENAVITLTELRHNLYF